MKRANQHHIESHLFILARRPRKFLVIHRLRVYQFEKQKGHLIIPPEEGPEISYPERIVSIFSQKQELRFLKLLNFFVKKFETYQSDIDDRLKNWYISIQPLLKENSL